MVEQRQDGPHAVRALLAAVGKSRWGQVRTSCTYTIPLGQEGSRQTRDDAHSANREEEAAKNVRLCSSVDRKWGNSRCERLRSNTVGADDGEETGTDVSRSILHALLDSMRSGTKTIEDEQEIGQRQGNDAK